MQTLWQDSRYGLRILAKSPGFTTVAVLTLALGIGANSAIFTLIDAVMLRELPVREPEQLVELSLVRLEGPVPFSYPMFRELERGQRVFSDLMAWSVGALSNVEMNGTLSQNTVVSVSGNYYSELGVSPLLGRLITPEDANPQSGSTSQVAVLGYAFWQRRFGAAGDVVGRQIRIEGQSFTIVGVTRKWFTGMSPGEPPEIIIPLAAQPLARSPNRNGFSKVPIRGDELNRRVQKDMIEDKDRGPQQPAEPTPREGKGAEPEGHVPPIRE
jgi:MacB-like periplasmic core domain